jgi:hypothetical protein
MFWIFMLSHHLYFLGKAYDITYVRLKFQSPRPESFAIYKRTTSDSEWIPYQYYSASCEATYGVRRNEYITRSNEQLSICSPEYSDISPLSGGNIAFSTLEGRPSAYNFENSPVLQVCEFRPHVFYLLVYGTADLLRLMTLVTASGKTFLRVYKGVLMTKLNPNPQFYADLN